MEEEKKLKNSFRPSFIGRSKQMTTTQVFKRLQKSKEKHIEPVLK